MWQQFSKLWARWRSLFDCAMEILNPAVLEEHGLKESFLVDFSRKIEKVYESAPPGKVRSCIVNLDTNDNWLVFQFNIAHTRTSDEIGIRFKRDELTVEFLPGGSATNAVSFFDNYGLRWVMLDLARDCRKLNEREKAKIERIIANVYSVAQDYKPQLQFLIGSSAKVRTREKKV